MGGRPAPLLAIATGCVVCTSRGKVELLREVDVTGADSCSEGWEQKLPQQGAVCFGKAQLCAPISSTSLMLTGMMFCGLFQYITTDALLTISSACFMSFISSFLMKNALLFLAKALK